MMGPKRKIPFNYTSADDEKVIRHLFGPEILEVIQKLELKKDTGRSSRLLYRFMGDLFILERNPFLFQEVVDHPRLRQNLFTEFRTDLGTIEQNAGEKDVIHVLDACKDKLDMLARKIGSASRSQHRILKQLSLVIGKDNIYFDPFNLTAHTTDATDWRRYTPVAVLRPDHESQVPELVQKIKALGFQIIPRGAGTGLTGGATPLAPNCIMLNTEKLNRISKIRHLTDKTGVTYGSIRLEAGVITQDAMDAAKAEGFVFATDPTSCWACTIGGNLSENAGGKTAVLYGTAIDNVLSYRITLPDGSACAVKRRNHPFRKILPEDEVVFDVFDHDRNRINTIRLNGTRIRRDGLGKDVTNKTLGGLLGIQKEGCDGIITSATFILYPEFKFKKTVCIEFFGNDMTEASQVIGQVTEAFKSQPSELMALEHFDEEYIKAIKYKTKTSVGTRLIAVLLVDIVSNEIRSLEQGIAALETLLESHDRTGFSIAADEKEAVRFWQDRKRLGAIAARTNAFKLNEDIVLPIAALPEFGRFVDQCNIEEKKVNQHQVIEDIVHYLDTAVPLSDPELLKKRVGEAKDLAYRTRKKLEIASRDALEAGIHAKNFYTDVMERLRGYTLVSENVTRIYEATTSRLIVIATHMHAGDGNVHVNIPVLSNDRQMMERAAQTADRVMEKALELKGAVSGEHGIGITKFKHLSPESIEEFTAYRKTVDPDGLMNPNKLSEPGIIDKVFTPSFNLLELEARILKHGSLSSLAMKIANCVRCGRCKPDCPVFFPLKNMFFHPRNKNLSIAALIEALLYISQRTQSVTLKILKNIEEIADHCTICHRCFVKCPVNIDTGKISIKERDILKDINAKHTPLATRMTLTYLSTRDTRINTALRAPFLKGGTRLQQLGSKLVSPLGGFTGMNRTRLFRMLKTPVTRPASRTLRSFLPKAHKNQAILLNPDGPVDATVFYFPGCGSERIFSAISMASIYLLLAHHNRVVLPPPFLCCGYPFLVNAQKETYNRITLENVMVLSQIRDMFQDLDFDACIVSCGTCMESMAEIDLSQIFECPVTDISAHILDTDPGILFENDYLYHAPCHDSLKDTAMTLFARHTADGARIDPTPCCCSEAGTLALSRPDITHAMLKRKTDVIQLQKGEGSSRILTNCPSCVQGLGRHKRDLDLVPVHLAEELARIHGGKNWKQTFMKQVLNSERVLF